MRIKNFFKVICYLYLFDHREQLWQAAVFVHKAQTLGQPEAKKTAHRIPFFFSIDRLSKRKGFGDFACLMEMYTPKKVYYCGRQCQKKHRPSHKDECARNMLKTIVEREEAAWAQ